VVLAGGRGTRLGGEGKAGVELAGRPMLAYVLEAMEGALDDVVVTAKASTALPGTSDGERVRVPGGRSVPLWSEPDLPRHPLAGLRSALARAEGRAILACACDMPLVTPALIEEIALADAQGAPAVVPRASDRLQPLLARYEPEALERLADADDELSLTAAVERLSPRVIEPADDELFFNVNTPEDVEMAAGELRRRRRS
jgi:molybdenum cofactor guanylyltransferase